MNDMEDLVKIITQKVIDLLGDEQVIELDNSPKIKVYGKETKELTRFLEKYGYTASSSKSDKLDIVLTNISLASLVRVSNMLPSTDEEHDILETLLSKRKVFILNSGREYITILKESPYGAKQHILTCEEQLVKFGAEFVNLELSTSKKEKKTLLTKNDLQKGFRNGVVEWKISPNTIITPLAKDFAREKQLTFNYVGEEE